VRRGRGLMPSGAGQLSSGAAVRAAGQVPSPSGRRPDRSLPCPPRPVPPWGMSVQPVERTSSVHTSGVQVSGASRCPDGQACGVRGAAAALSAPRRTGVRAAPRLGAAGRRALVVGGRRGRLPCIGPDQKRRGRRWPWLACTRVDRSPGPPLGRRPGSGAAWPPGRHGRWSRARVPAGWRGSMGQSRCSQAPAGRPGQVAGVMAGHGPGPRGDDHAEWSLGLVVVPGLSAPEGPLGSVGRSLRPQRGRRA
jgi:hypothetical protein